MHPNDIPAGEALDAWSLHKSMQAHGANDRLRELDVREYAIMRGLRSSDATLDLMYKGYYLGPNGRLYRDGRPFGEYRSEACKSYRGASCRRKEQSRSATPIGPRCHSPGDVRRCTHLPGAVSELARRVRPWPPDAADPGSWWLNRGRT